MEIEGSDLLLGASEMMLLWDVQDMTTLTVIGEQSVDIIERYSKYKL